ncbi:MAG: class I SAM-dependent methyltransferase [Propionibacteriaceae bacterium]|jgi:SAM-dependent methyltransferase|nr:class I SAM-dependent methyltransferase [Propionibacteriaceae bacterium]
MASPLLIPPPALEWLLGADPAAVLVIGAAGGYPSLIAQAGHDVTVIERQETLAGHLAERRPDLHMTVARGEALPFDPCCFDAVVSFQNFHTFAPGLALSEWARVLRPGGWVSLAYLKRDDSIPWVKRLAGIVQSRLPEAMRGKYGDGSMVGLEQSPYFPTSQRRNFRIWAPCDRADLQGQASRAKGNERLSAAERGAMLEEVGKLYDACARVPDPLQLPYSLTCCRGVVDHAELTAALVPDQDGLRLTL